MIGQSPSTDDFIIVAIYSNYQHKLKSICHYWIMPWLKSEVYMAKLLIWWIIQSS